jgi:hypothetical protein
MPCDEIILNTVEIKAANVEMLADAIAALPEADRQVLVKSANSMSMLRIAERIVNSGAIPVPAGQEFLADKIKQEYSRQAIQAAARKFNWRLQEKPGNKMTATKRV